MKEPQSALLKLTNVFFWEGILFTSVPNLMWSERWCEGSVDHPGAGWETVGGGDGPVQGCVGDACLQILIQDSKVRVSYPCGYLLTSSSSVCHMHVTKDESWISESVCEIVDAGNISLAAATGRRDVYVPDIERVVGLDVDGYGEFFEVGVIL